MLENPQIYEKFNKRILNPNNTNNESNMNKTSMNINYSFKSINKSNLNMTGFNHKPITQNSTKENFSKKNLKNSFIDYAKSSSTLNFNESISRKGSISAKRLPAIDCSVQINRLEQEILEVSHIYNYTKFKNNEKKIQVDKLRSTITNEINNLKSISNSYFNEEKELNKKKEEISFVPISNEGKIVIIKSY